VCVCVCVREDDDDDEQTYLCSTQCVCGIRIYCSKF